MSSLREKLIASRARIADPRHWIKGQFAHVFTCTHLAFKRGNERT